MTHVSATIYTFWSILSVTLFGFLISHLWKFDRFQCLRWGRGKQSGAFKRVMTFSYLTSVPLLCIYSIGMMVIKYREGYTDIPGIGIYPTPYNLWSPGNARLIMPMYMIFSCAWGLEIVSHLEELCFWLFLITVGPSHSSWFRSIQFKVWVLGSLIGMIGMPLLTWFTRSDPLKCEAYTFLGGSIASLLITLWSIRVLWVFPHFVNRVRSAGGEPEVVVRLTTFHDLNITRVIFRLFFVISLLILASDGMTKHQHINESLLWTDFLASVAGVGLVVSSAFTLLIFFPRSIEREAGYKPRRKSTTGRAEEISLQPIASVPDPERGRDNMMASPIRQSGQPLSPTTGKVPTLTMDEGNEQMFTNGKRTEVWEMVTTSTPPPTYPYGGSAIGIDLNSRTRIIPPARPHRNNIHPLLMNYSSPINFTEEDSNPPRRLHRPYNAV